MNLANDSARGIVRVLPATRHEMNYGDARSVAVGTGIAPRSPRDPYVQNYSTLDVWQRRGSLEIGSQLLPEQRVVVIYGVHKRETLEQPVQTASSVSGTDRCGCPVDTMIRKRQVIQWLTAACDAIRKV